MSVTSVQASILSVGAAAVVLLSGALLAAVRGGASVSEGIWDAWLLVADPGSQAELRPSAWAERGLCACITVVGVFFVALLLAIVLEAVQSRLRVITAINAVKQRRNARFKGLIRAVVVLRRLRLRAAEYVYAPPGALVRRWCDEEAEEEEGVRRTTTAAASRGDEKDIVDRGESGGEEEGEEEEEEEEEEVVVVRKSRRGAAGSSAAAKKRTAKKKKRRGKDAAAGDAAAA